MGVLLLYYCCEVIFPTKVSNSDMLKSFSEVSFIYCGEYFIYLKKNFYELIFIIILVSSRMFSFSNG